jgi:uncharacterized protein YndB with AHSA1/START domain
MIKVTVFVGADIDRVWHAWVTPEHIMKWNAASEDWHTTYAEVDLKPGGQFLSTMAAKDGSMSFDFKGVFSRIIENNTIEYVIEDGRRVIIKFAVVDGGVRITETFDPEQTHSAELQQAGWQSILDNFASYVKSLY